MLGSVAVHAGLLAWLGGGAAVVVESDPEPEPEPAIEWIEVSVVDRMPLAAKAGPGAPREAVPRAPPVLSEVEAPAETPPLRARPRPEAAPVQSAIPDEPAIAEPAIDEPAIDEPAVDEPASSPPSSESPGTGAAASEGRGTGESEDRGSGEGEADHSAYGAEIVRLVLAEIDRDPVLGISAKDSIEVELEILPSGRLARRGLGKYDYAVVVTSSVGPLRTRGILRRIASASRRFPPHPADFPRQRYLVGITVSFRDRPGGA